MPTFGSITRLHKPVNLLPMISQRTLHNKDAPVYHQVSRRRIDQRLSQAPPMNTGRITPPTLGKRETGGWQQDQCTLWRAGKACKPRRRMPSAPSKAPEVLLNTMALK